MPEIIEPVTGSTVLSIIVLINASIAAGFAILVPVVTKGGNVVTTPSPPVVSLPPPPPVLFLPPPPVAVAAVVVSLDRDVSVMYGLYAANPGT